MEILLATSTRRHSQPFYTKISLLSRFISLKLFVVDDDDDWCHTNEQNSELLSTCRAVFSFNGNIYELFEKSRVHHNQQFFAKFFMSRFTFLCCDVCAQETSLLLYIMVQESLNHQQAETSGRRSTRFHCVLRLLLLLLMMCTKELSRSNTKQMLPAIQLTQTYASSV